MRYGRTIGLTVLLLLAGVVFAACEDDPIIGPTDEDDSGGGSYGMLHFDRSPADEGGSVPGGVLRRENPNVF